MAANDTQDRSKEKEDHDHTEEEPKAKDDTEDGEDKEPKTKPKTKDDTEDDEGEDHDDDNEKGEPAETAIDSTTGAVAGVPVVAFKLKAIRQEEIKEFSLDLRKREAAQRTFAPQHYLGFLLPKDPASYVTKVNFDDQFFQRFKIELRPPAEAVYDKIALSSISADIWYPAKNGTLVEKDKVPDTFEKTHNQPQVFKLAVKNQDYGYKIKYRVNFQDNESSGWKSKKNDQGGPSTSYAYEHVEPQDTNGKVNTSYTLNPTEYLKFIQVKIEAVDNFPWERYPSVKVEMHYQDYDPNKGTKDHPKKQAGKAPEEIQQTFVLKMNSSKPEFKVRADAADASSYQYRYIYTQADVDQQGRPLITPWKTDISPTLLVSGPSTIPVKFYFDGDIQKMSENRVNITVKYVDKENNWEWEKTLSIPKKELVTLKDEGNPKEISIPVADPDQKTFTYQVKPIPWKSETPPHPKSTEERDVIVTFPVCDTPPSSG